MRDFVGILMRLNDALAVAFGRVERLQMYYKP